jgi:L-alanine-DL-glutamate epimerase-like enolase superfamily enzyme
VAVEMACCDLAGKAWGVPCWQMLGGKFRNQIRMYADTPSSRDPEVMGQAERTPERDSLSSKWTLASRSCSKSKAR